MFKRLFIFLLLSLTACLSTHAAETLAKPNDDLQAILDRGDDLLLRKNTVYRVKDTLTYKHPGQRIATLGAESISEYATLRIDDPKLERIINGNQVSNIILEKVIVDGNRYRLSAVAKFHEVPQAALMFFGGRNAENQIIRKCVFMNTRTWSTLKIHEGGNGIIAEDNIIIGAGTGPRGNGRDVREVPFNWGDGISCASRNTIVRNNLIIDPTDVGIVFYGAPGSLAEDNVVAAISRESLGAINLVDPIIYALNEEETLYDYNGVVVRGNLMDSRGGRFHIAMPMGAPPWHPRFAGKVLQGAIVHGNTLAGGAAAYGFVADDIQNFQIYDNVSTAKFSGRGDGIHLKPPDDPGPFLYNPDTVKGSRLQKEFKPQEKHLYHLLRCNHGPRGADGYRAYPYGEHEVIAVIETAFLEMLGRSPSDQELSKWETWLQETRGNSDHIRRTLMQSDEFIERFGYHNPTDLHLFRTDLWIKVIDHVMPDLKTRKDRGWPKAESIYSAVIEALPKAHEIPSIKGQFKPVTAAKTLKGNVMCGYQGWFRTPTDNSGLGWEHYETYSEEFEPGKVGIEFWPDMSEATKSERYKTKFKHKDGRPAEVFTSQNPDTVNRHFEWMQQYGIDGVFLQRFAHDVLEGGHHQWKLLQPSNNQIVKYVQQGAQNNGRSWALMYDLTSVRHGEMPMVMDDWRGLCDRLDILNDANYQHHNGKPVIAIWGVGFSDKRAYTLDEVSTLVDFLQNDENYGGCTVMLGVPTYWRTLDRDATGDPKFHELIKKADMILPWSVGRFGGSAAALRHGQQQFAPDIKWCRQNGVEYMPLAFPGFSWANRKGPETHEFNKIPRENGKFLWSQMIAARRAGADMLYVAMFDEMDEGTQIFKVTNDPPAGKSRFLSYEPMAPDFYLKLTGMGGKLMRNQIPPNDDLPKM